MPLPTPCATRVRRHRRTIDVTVYACGNGRWEVDAVLTDVKTHDVPLAGGVRRAGEPIHDMLLRLVIDKDLNILEAGSNSRWVPYRGHCEAHGDAYAQLAGLNLLQGFRRAVMQRLGGVDGCTHLTELSQNLPTAVLQAFAGDVIDTRGAEPDSGKPFQLDRCHALRSDGEVVRLHYPRWHRQQHAKNPAQNAAADAASPGAEGGSPPAPSPR